MDWTEYPPPDKYGLAGLNYPTPNPLDLIIIVEQPLRGQGYLPLPAEVPHEKDTTCRLTWQGPAKGDGQDINVRRIYANDRPAQEPYNLLNGDNEAKNTDFPLFIRSYLLPRIFTPSTLGVPLTALTSISVTAAGTTALTDGRYALTFSTGNAAGFCNVINGKVVGAFLSDTGSGYSVGALPTVTCTSTTATFAVTMQPASCILSDEVVSEAEDMMKGRFVRVKRYWETIPGAWTETTKLGEAGQVVTTRKRKNLVDAITSGETLSGGLDVWYRTEKQNAYGVSDDGSRPTRAIAGNDLYAEEVVESEALPGPTRLGTRRDEDGVEVDTETTRVPASQIVTNEDVIGDIWTRRFGKEVPGSTEVMDQVVESRVVPGPAVAFDRIDSLDQQPIRGTKTIDLVSTIEPLVGETISGSDWVRTTMEPIEGSTLVARKIVETRAATGAVVADKPLSGIDGTVTATSHQLRPISSITDVGESVVSSNTWQKISQREHEGSSEVALKVIETHTVPGQALRDTKLDFDGVSINIDRQLVEAATLGDATEADSMGVWTRTYRERVTGSSVVAFLITEARPSQGNTIESDRLDWDGVAVFGYKQLLPAASIVNSESIVGSTWFRKFGVEHQGSAVVMLQMIESRALDAASVPFDELDPLDQVHVTGTRMLRDKSLITTVEDIDGGGNWVRTYGATHAGSSLVQVETNESRSATGEIVTTTENREAGDVVTGTMQLLPISTPIVSNEEIDGSNNWILRFQKSHRGSTKVAIQVIESRPSTGGTSTSKELRENGDIVQIDRALLPKLSAGPSEAAGGGFWVRNFNERHPQSALVVWNITETRTVPGNQSSPSKERDSDGAEVTVTRILKALPITTSEGVSGSTWTAITIEPMRDSHVVGWETTKVRALPGPVVTEIKDGPNNIPMLLARQKVSSATTFTQLGEFQPTALSISSVGLGSTSTIVTTTPHGLPIGAWVIFSGTNSTPPVGTQTSGALVVGGTYIITTFVTGDDFANVGALTNASGVTFTATGTTATTYSNGSTLTRALQILSTPTDSSFTVTPSAAVTVIGGAVGTVQGKHRILREIHATDNATIKLKTDTMLAIADVSIFNEDVGTWKVEDLPDFIKAFIMYTELSAASSAGTTITGKADWSGVASFPTQHGYRGPVVARRRRFFFIGPPPDWFSQLFSPTIIIPSSGVLAIEGGSSSFSRNILVGASSSSTSQSNTWRPAVTPTGLTGELPAITVLVNGQVAATYNISSIVGGGGGSLPSNVPKINLSGSPGLAATWWVLISGSNCTPSIDGVKKMITFTSTSFQIVTVQGAPVTVAGGAAGAVTLLGLTEDGAGVAQGFLDIPQSVPAKLVGSLGITAISTSTTASPTLTLDAKHYFRVGQRVKLSGTNSTPSIDGFVRVIQVPATNQIKVKTLVPVTGTGNAGTMTNILTTMEQPQKLGSTVWDAYVWDSEVPYGSGDVPA